MKCQTHVLNTMRSFIVQFTLKYSNKEFWGTRIRRKKEKKSKLVIGHTVFYYLMKRNVVMGAALMQKADLRISNLQRKGTYKFRTDKNRLLWGCEILSTILRKINFEFRGNTKYHTRDSPPALFIADIVHNLCRALHTGGLFGRIIFLRVLVYVKSFIEWISS